MIKKVINSLSAHKYYYLVISVLFLYETCMFLAEVDAYSHSYNITLTKPLLGLLVGLLTIYVIKNIIYIPKASYINFWRNWLIITLLVCLPIHILLYPQYDFYEITIQFVRLFYLPVMLFYFTAIQFRKNEFDAHSAFLPYLVFWIVIAFLYFKNIGIIVALRETQNLLYSVNFVYYLFLAIPALLFFKKNIYIPALIITAIAIMLSGKRGPIFVILLICLIHPILQAFIAKGRVSKSIGALLLMAVALLFLSVYYQDIFERSIDRVLSLKSDKGSGREDIYKIVLEGYFNKGVSGIVFGNGFESTKVLTDGYTAHNDIIEVLYNYGFIAFLILLSLYKNLIEKIKIMYRRLPAYAFGYWGSVILFVFLSNISHIINYPHFMLLVPLWSFVFYQVHNIESK